MAQQNPRAGLLGYLREGALIIAIHANWPAYPPPDASLALYDLGQFPEGTEFFRIDEIDECTLFRAEVGPAHGDLFDERGYHVAIWNDDLRELADAGWISGVRTITDLDRIKTQRAELESEIREAYVRANAEVPKDLLAGASAGGTSLAARWDERIWEAEAEMEDWEGLPCSTVVLVDKDQPVVLSHQGWAEIADLLAADPPASLSGRLAQLHDLGLHDTAIRDASVILESAIRDAAGNKSYGLSLVEAFIKVLRTDGRWADWEILRFRNDLRTVFKFIRNQFAHEIVDVPAIRAKVLLDRITLLIDAVRISRADPGTTGP